MWHVCRGNRVYSCDRNVKKKKKRKERIKDKSSTSCGNPKKMFPISHLVGITLIILLKADDLDFSVAV